MVQMIVKDDHGRVINARRSVTRKMTCYHVSDEKQLINSQSAFCT